MLLQTNSYIVPKDRRAEHARLMRRFRQVLAKLGCDMFEVYEQVGQNWQGGEDNRRCVQIIRFRDRKHQATVQNAERNDPAAQALIAEFCDLVNFPYQQQQGYFATGFYNSVLPIAPTRVRGGGEAEAGEEAAVAEAEHDVEVEAIQPAPPPSIEPEVSPEAPAHSVAAPLPPPPMEEIVVEAVRVEESAIAPEAPAVEPEAEPELESAGEAAETQDAAEEPLEYGDVGDELPEETGAPLTEDELLGELSPLGEPHDPHAEAERSADDTAEHAPQGKDHNEPPADDENGAATEEPHRHSLFRRRPQSAPNPSQTD